MSFSALTKHQPNAERVDGTRSVPATMCKYIFILHYNFICLEVFLNPRSELIRHNFHWRGICHPVKTQILLAVPHHLYGIRGEVFLCLHPKDELNLHGIRLQLFYHQVKTAELEGCPLLE